MPLPYHIPHRRHQRNFKAKQENASLAKLHDDDDDEDIRSARMRFM